ncbi:MAG TPA: DUF4112 domain-containing protein [Nostocaceae cyanobacterium]|nr:DUF4112 domain-containing protein [Nostocaceae cyanobacterium]
MSNSREPFILNTDAFAPKLKRLRQITKLLDKAITIPGTDAGIGLDPLIGLLPVGGDVLGLIFSFYIIIEAAQLGVSNSTLGKMILNVIIDALIGSLPMLGDLFDVIWTANSYNIDLLEKDLKSSPYNRKPNKTFLILLIVSLALLGIILIVLPMSILWMLWSFLTGS